MPAERGHPLKLNLINGLRVTAEGTEPNLGIRVGDDGVIKALDRPGDGESGPVTLALPETALVYPGLINAHDHLIGTFQPRVGAGPYLNWLQWDNDLKRSAVFRQRNMIDSATVYQLGGLKAILSGVTTVADHIPRKISEPQIDRLPVRLVAPYCLAHSVASFRLHWGDGLAVEYARASGSDLPFMVHVGEGHDPETRGELAALDRQQALGPQTLLVHGVSFTAADAALAAGRGASLAWCPGSNLFMFGMTTDIGRLIEAGVNICLGTDSLVTGTPSLLVELRRARTCYNERGGEELSGPRVSRPTSSVWRPGRRWPIRTKLWYRPIPRISTCCCVAGGRCWVVSSTGRSSRRPVNRSVGCVWRPEAGAARWNGWWPVIHRACWTGSGRISAFARICPSCRLRNRAVPETIEPG